MLSTRDKMKRDADWGEIIGLRKAADEHAWAARRAHTKGKNKLADSEEQMSDVFARSAERKHKLFIETYGFDIDAV